MWTDPMTYSHPMEVGKGIATTLVGAGISISGMMTLNDLATLVGGLVTIGGIAWSAWLAATLKKADVERKIKADNDAVERENRYADAMVDIKIQLERMKLDQAMLATHVEHTAQSVQSLVRPPSSPQKPGS